MFSYIITGFLIFVNLSLSFAQNANNEITSGALQLTNLNDYCSANAAYSTAEMKSEQPPATCLNSPLRYARWFKFKATTSSVEIKVKIGKEEGTLHFPYITLRDESLKQLACAQYADETEDLLLSFSELIPTKTYYFSVNNHNNSKYIGTFKLCVTDVESYDEKAGAVKIFSLKNFCSEKAAYSTLGATADQGTPSCLKVGPNFNRWFIFTATSKTIEAVVKSGGNNGTCQFAIATLWDESGKEIVCNNLKNETEEAAVKYDNFVIGNSYYLSVDHPYNKQYPGTFTLCVNDFSTPPQLKPAPSISQVAIRGKMVYPDGRPLQGSKILLLDKNNSVVKSILTDGNGRFRFDGLSADEIHQVQIEANDPNLKIDIYMTTPGGEVVKKTVRDKKQFHFIELPRNCSILVVIDCDNPGISVSPGKVGIIGKLIDKIDPTNSIEKQKVYLFNNPQNMIDSVQTDIFGKFQFPNLIPSEDYLIKLDKPQKNTYAEMAIVNDKGRVFMTANSKNVDSKGFFRFEKLPALVPEAMSLKKENDARLELSAISDISTIARDQPIVLNNIHFEQGEFNLLEKSFAELNELAKILKEKQTLNIEVSGHTDSTGAETTNVQLSENRAKSVVDYLTSKGIDKKRLNFLGYGSSKPVAGNDTEEGRTQNRRVEFRVVSK